MSPITAQTPFVPGPIVSAGATSLADSISGQPFISEGLLDYFRAMLIGIVSARIQGSAVDTLDGTAKTTIIWKLTQGILQPGNSEKLSIQAEGERSWQNGLLHTTPDFNVATDTILIIKDVPYRVMEKKDFSVNGYVEYQILETYAARN